jgi:beta-mannanase
MKASISILLLVITGYFAQAQNELPSDKNATTETVRLYNNLKRVMNKGYLFGHQDDRAYGVKWKYIDKKSDVKDVTGEYPAMYGYDLSHLELNEQVNIDTVPFKNMKEYIQQGYKQGAVITISWHGTNPLSGKSAWDNTPGAVTSILPGGPKHEVFKAQLDKIAAFLSGLKDKNGTPIPVLYRPFHELSGDWFWWGTKCCTPGEMKEIYRFTVHYLRDVKNVHNLLYVYNTGDNFNSAEGFLDRYPGDDVVDVLSFDTYQYGDPSGGSKFIADLDMHLSVIEQLAKSKNKIPALAEAGYNHIPDSTWWTNVLAKALNGHHPAYVLLWRNAGYKLSDNSVEYYAPYPGHPSAADFLKFYQLPQTLFQKDAARERLYK